jgi:ABC-type multidrug transport system fused ATPase/permease subunit
MAFFEVAGIGALGPFMAVVADPSVVQSQPMLRTFYEIGGFESTRSFLFALGLALIALIVTGNAFRILTLYAILRFNGACRANLGLRLFRQYLYRPYTYFLDHNTSELSKGILTEIDLVVNGVLKSAMDVFARGVVAVSILAYLFARDPVVATVAGTVFLTMYGLIYWVVRPRLMRHGEELGHSNETRFKATSEAFGAVKELKILGREPRFEELYADGARRFAWSQAAKEILMVVPKHLLETVAFGLMVVLILVLLAVGEGIAGILPLLSVYGFAAYRLMPSLQIVFSGVAQIRYFGHTVDSLHREMQDVQSWVSVGPNGYAATQRSREPLPFENNLELRSLSFYYPTSTDPVLDHVSMQIAKNTTVGFVGTTGCGKTTLVDVIMGLLEPSSGSILVDGSEITSDQIQPWQRNFGYVPQGIFLSDASVAANIALGVPEYEIDAEALEEAAKAANLHEFVENELPHGYNTVVGERGIRLSGGQKQRIGIARALYHDPAILVMDEATSALDSVTEEAVMDAIQNLIYRKTILLIAHRLTTVQDCDVIYLLDKGRIRSRGTYEELLQMEPRFRAMAKSNVAT